MQNNLGNEIAESVGLWLAEGDKKTISEVTLTNNSVSIILDFSKTISKIYNGKNKPRIYIYSPLNSIEYNPFENIRVRFYIDKRASKPYYIYKIADVKFVKKWNLVVKEIMNEKSLYKNILRGFFAGEGNIKFNPNCGSRSVRIAQGKRNYFIEKILENIGLTFRFSSFENAYVISGRKNLEKILEFDITTLHKEKNRKFVEMMETYKERHYPNNYIKKSIVNYLNRPKTSKELSKKFNRSHSRITKVLIDLKKEGKVTNFKVHRKTYWTTDNIILISKIKSNILGILKEPKTTIEVAKIRKKDYKSTFRRLKEIEKLGLVERLGDKKWIRLKNTKKVMIK